MALELIVKLLFAAFCCVSATSHENETLVLNPPYFNIARGREIEATATCGEGFATPGEQGELYCKLTGNTADIYRPGEHVIIQGQYCDNCDPSDPAKAHPIEYAIDGTEKWWQSPPLSRGMSYNEVNVTISLGQLYQVAYVLIKFANSPRPGMFVLERSRDYGETYEPWQYFAETPSDCQSEFGMQSLEEIQNDDDVICTAGYSDIVPLEDGEIVVSLVNNRPGAPHSSTLQEWITATHIRIRLLRTNTLLGHLMAVARQDPTITRRYFYSIKDITIGGRCACNGHATYCDLPANDGSNKQVCRCEHNTCGSECETCCPGYVQKAWRTSSYSNPFVCERCNCHSHSNECIYDEEVALSRGSMDINGNMEGGGVCQNCQHNTMGVNCHLCKPGFFRPEGRKQSDYDVCQPCMCDPILSTGNCAPLTGQCECKPEYAGPDCTECNEGYYGYPYCRPCDCNVNGTENKVCQVNGGQCPCKPNFTGRNCNLCALSYYGFPECQRCDCNTIGSYDIVCDSENGQCSCREIYDGRSCDRCRDGHYNFPTCNDCSCSQFGTEDEICNKTNGECLCRENFGGDRCDRCALGYYNYPECLPCECDLTGSFNGQCDDSGQCPCESNFGGLKCDQCSAGYYKYPACEPCNCDRYGSFNVLCDQVSGQCSCRPNFQGRMCQQCGDGFYNYPNCEECNCDPAGVIDVPGQPLGGCGSATGGACLCKDNVMGRTCDTCKPLYWNLEISNPYGCEDCNCNLAGTVGGMAICDIAHAPWHKSTGQCYCKGQVTGRTCDECRDGTYLLDASNPIGCQDCNCDVGGSVHAACNKQTGQCVCRPRVTGVRCDMPEANHFVPDLHQMKFEAEDGYTPNGRRVRFGYDGFEFPGFSYLGYAIMSAIQPEIRIPVTVESPSIYRIILRYYYPNAGGPTRGRMTVTPADPSQVQASEQSSGIIFVSTVNPQFVTVEGSGVIKPFVLNPGSWVVAIEAPEGILIDYVVLLPSDFYEATILQEHTTEPCIVGTPQQRCNFYVFPEVDQFYVAPGVDGYSVDGGGGRYPVQRFGDDLIMQELGVDSMALVDVNQNIYGIDLPIDRAGRYVIIFEYYGGGPGQNSGLLDVYGSQDTQQGELIFNDCSFLCRSIVLDDDNRVKVFDIQEVMPYAQLTKIGSPYMLSISRVIAIPVESFSYDFVTPTLECVRTADGECLPSTYPVPPNTILLDGDMDPNVPLPPNIYNPSPTVIYLSNDNENTASYDDDLVPNSGEVVFVIHYYQPNGQSYDANFRVVGQFDGEGTFNAKYCPHVSGCRVVVTKPDGSNVFELSDLSQGIQVTLPDGGDRQLWIDDIMIIPVEMYTPDLINANPQDRAGEFIQYCSANDFYFSPDSSGFCREAVFSLSSAFNYGASECDCDSQGSLSFNCDELGGQCQCRQNIVGRRCNKCAVGYYDFPYCRACTCQSGVCNEVSGECICPENVAGANCDTCAPQTYGYHPIVGCVDCECDIRGVDNDDLNCDFFTGQCNCKPNIGGRQCERCERGYYGYPYCEPCNCDVNGTTEEICDQTTAQCLCKDNVYGDQCNQCEPGTFYLADSNPEGCISCFCFGVSSDCQSYTRRRAKIDMVDGWTTVNFDPSQIQYGSNFANIYVSGTGDDPQSAIYWSASDKFIGNKLTSYGGKLEYTVRNNPQPAIGIDGPAQPMRRPDILISGNNISIMYLHINQPEPGQDLSVSVELKENNFQYSISAAEVSRSDFMTVLANIDSLQIRAQYYDRILTADLVGVSMDTTKRNGDGAVAQEVERCRCPPQYQGLSCEQCAEGHYRLPGSGPYLGQCVPCNCNGHASQCDPKTGQCLNCQHNTEGDQCERCKNGYYGDAPSGEPDACKICSCPQPVENLNFAQTCTFSPEGEQFCICQPGHTGQYCDQCVEGYYGNPYQGQACRRCDCSGNTDPNTGLSECDQSSGNCTSCRVETKGRRCEDCNDWYYGDARAQNCQACSCDQCGSESCDHLNGVCNCRPNVVGYDCERCAVGYWNYHSCSGCLACDCAVGAIDSQCDMETGQCTCMPGVGGEKCDACLHGYWNYGPNGCYECGCDPKLRCDPNTGECLCPPGAMGENCDECEDRYILTEQGCQPCDECVHLLLDIVEEMAGDLDEADRNLTGITVGVVAFQRLNQLNQSIHDLIPQVDELEENNDLVRRSLGNFTYQIDDLKYQAGQVEERAMAAGTNGLDTAIDADILKGRARQIEAEANATIDFIHDVVRELQAIGNGTISSNTNLGELLARAQEILEELRNRDLNPGKEAAEEEKRLAQELLDRARSLQNDSQEVGQRADEVGDDVGGFIDKLNELMELCRHSDNVTDQVNAILDKHRPPAYEAILAEVNAKNEMAQDEVRNASNLIDDAAGFLADARAAIQASEVNGSKLESAIRELEDFIDRYEAEGEGLPELVQNATDYANGLLEYAKELNRTFDSTRNQSKNALKAVNAYQDIVNAIDEAERAARAALNASELALAEANSFGTEPQDSKRRSKKLLKKAAEAGDGMDASLFNQSMSLRDQLNEVEQVVDTVKENLDSVGNGLEEIERGLLAIPSATSECTIVTECDPADIGCRLGFSGDNCDIANLGNLAEGAANTAMAAEDIGNNAKDRADDIIARAGDVKAKLDGLGDTIQEANDRMASSQNSLDEINRIYGEIPDIRDRLRMQHRLMGNMTLSMTYDLAEIQKKIAEARSLANGIKVAAKFGPDSYVELKAPAEVSESTPISSFSFYFTTQANDGLLYYVGGPASSDDYLALTIENRNLVFRYNLGDDDAMTQVAQDVTDGMWRYVLVERYGRYAKVTVTTESTGKQDGESSSSGEFTLLDLQPDSIMFIGGAPENAQLPGVISNRDFVGGMDEFQYGDTPIGVWNFVNASSVNEGIMRNVTDLAVTTDPDDPPSAVMFDGTGYAIVPRGTKEMAVGNRIQMQIKTLSPNGLLLFAGNEGETFFVEMRGGRIYYEYDLGSGPVSQRSKNMYNNNKWTTINLFRAGQATQLFTISQEAITEDFASFSSPGSETELATNDLIYIGGLVAIPDGQFPTVTRERFRGCMANLVISSQNVDLTAADVQTAGFFPACIRQDIRVATYPRPSGGYTELAMVDGLDLMRDGDFILRFRTEEPDGLMLYTADDTQSSSVAIMMSNGAVLVVAHKDGSTAELLTPENAYSDGMWHTINVRRPARRANREPEDELSLSVDDNDPVLEAFNSRGMKTAGMLFVGGVPEGYDLGPITVPPAANAPFIGCLADISSKYDKITFANRMRDFNAFYGFCDPLLSSNATEEEVTLTSPAPTDAASTEGASTPPSMRNDGPCVLSSNPEEAPEDPSNEGAVQFGVLADSHVAFPRQITKQYKNEYNISVAVRTGARNGLMYYAADDSQIDILTLFLYEGRPVMVFNLGSGNLRLEPEDGRTINDAQWHTIRTYRKRTEGELYIDGELVASGNSGPGARLLQTTSPFYWGGLNRTLTISNNDVNEASQIGLLGCMKDLANNGVPFGNPSSEYEIQACSQLIEPGVYFGPGKGYVIPDETFGVNQRMEVRMSIKPRVKSGVIFSVAKPQMDFASLELIDGQLFFRVQNGAGVIEATYMPPEGSAFLCDGNWHDLLVTKEGSVLQITVDGDEGEVVTGPSGATAANTNNPLYFGGLPDGEEGNHPGIQVNAHYVGCMRDIMVNDDLINMSAGLFEGDVDTRSCAAN
ncbi:laminin subunit alpha-like isoform X1 [Lytechinus variegatus]|uniref:laminin subunit alpha-like isoform X1 n=1 Tax=Lytechinus variegatus TaxID=7654 RepID=UPI001BB24680|nr:laminin subunit alpha-like isoform X1 [Lytechinus variegatus]